MNGSGADAHPGLPCNPLQLWWTGDHQGCGSVLPWGDCTNVPAGTCWTILPDVGLYQWGRSHDGSRGLSLPGRRNWEYLHFTILLLSLANSLATTAGANMTGTAIVFTHNIFTEQFIKVLQPDTSL